jgi:hypothetical protein
MRSCNQVLPHPPSSTPEIKLDNTFALKVGLEVLIGAPETRLHKLQNRNNMAAKCHETTETRRPAAASPPAKSGMPQYRVYASLS